MSNNDAKIKRMKELKKVLLEASKSYYDSDIETMSNFEYDKLYDELVELEKETGIILAGSPTTRVGYTVSTELPKETFSAPLLSLDKTKSVDDLKSWLKDKEGLLSWKLDGLTIALNYEGGELTKAVTRGDGYIGEVVTNNARVFDNLPTKIDFDGELKVRGEAVIRYSDFEKINATIEDVDAKYKNPRNLSSGSVRQLNNEITAKRHVRFYAFTLVSAEGVDFHDSRKEQMEFLAERGFDTVEYFTVNADNIDRRVEYFKEKIKHYDIPSDGLVLTYEDIAYGKSLGSTSKFPRDSIAFKWQDEIKETILREIEWSTSRTGLINPIAIFDPIEIEGTTVSRASVHNVSIMEELKLGIGDKITVYKANMIIPQIAENMTKSGNIEIPDECPVCGGKAVLKDENGIKFLYCTNDDCVAKQIKAFSHFVSRNAMNIEGLSEATLEKFIGSGFIKEFADIFRLADHRDEIVVMEGFGERSYNNLIEAINTARHTTQVRLLYSLGVPNIGLANAKLICKACDYKWNQIEDANENKLVAIDGIGEVMAKVYAEYFSDSENRRKVSNILDEIEFNPVEVTAQDDTLKGLTFVITGSLNGYENRDELKALIESKGGKVTGSVSEKTDYLINNDVDSTSGKNKKAKELGKSIITEDEFNKMI